MEESHTLLRTLCWRFKMQIEYIAYYKKEDGKLEVIRGVLTDEDLEGLVEESENRNDINGVKVEFDGADWDKVEV